MLLTNYDQCIAHQSDKTDDAKENRYNHRYNPLERPICFGSVDRTCWSVCSYAGTWIAHWIICTVVSHFDIINCTALTVSSMLSETSNQIFRLFSILWLPVFSLHNCFYLLHKSLVSKFNSLERDNLWAHSQPNVQSFSCEQKIAASIALLISFGQKKDCVSFYGLWKMDPTLISSLEFWYSLFLSSAIWSSPSPNHKSQIIFCETFFQLDNLWRSLYLSFSFLLKNLFVLLTAAFCCYWIFSKWIFYPLILSQINFHDAFFFVCSTLTSIKSNLHSILSWSIIFMYLERNWTC